MKKKLLTTIIASLFVFSALAQQFDLSAELRPRFENKRSRKNDQ